MIKAAMSKDLTAKIIAIILAVVVWAQAVSYTHLDVYKRQG